MPFRLPLTSGNSPVSTLAPNCPTPTTAASKLVLTRVCDSLLTLAVVCEVKCLGERRFWHRPVAI